MRKAFTLVEMLVVIMVLPVVMLVVSGVYATFIRDIPRTTRVLQQNTTVLNLLEQIRRDMDQAVALPDPTRSPAAQRPAGPRAGQLDGQNAGARTLLIEQPGRVIRYEFGEGQVVRTQSGEERLWRMPDAVVSWRPWTRDGEAYAIEIHSHVQQWVSDHLTKKLAGSYVFFVNGLGAQLVSDY